jgi:hypothetical protein
MSNDSNPNVKLFALGGVQNDLMSNCFNLLFPDIRAVPSQNSEVSNHHQAAQYHLKTAKPPEIKPFVQIKNHLLAKYVLSIDG